MGLSVNLVGGLIMGLPYWVNFWSLSVEFNQFPDLWVAEQYPRIYIQSADRIELNVVDKFIMGVFDFQLRFNEFLQLPCLWLWEQFLIICTQTIYELSTYLVGKLVIGLSRPHRHLAMFREFPAFHGIWFF